MVSNPQFLSHSDLVDRRRQPAVARGLDTLKLGANQRHEAFDTASASLFAHALHAHRPDWNPPVRFVKPMIPLPKRWVEARSFKAIPGMTNEEKDKLQKSLRSLKRKHLDESKLWQYQDEAAVQLLMDEVCAEFPFLRERYEDAWPVQACLRSRLSTSSSHARRRSGASQKSSPRQPLKRAREKTVKSPASVHDDDDDDDASMRDELESSSSPPPDGSVALYRSEAGSSGHQELEVGLQALSNASPDPLLDPSWSVPEQKMRLETPNENKTPKSEPVTNTNTQGSVASSSRSVFPPHNPTTASRSSSPLTSLTSTPASPMITPSGVAIASQFQSIPVSLPTFPTTPLKKTAMSSAQSPQLEAERNRTSGPTTVPAVETPGVPGSGTQLSQPRVEAPPNEYEAVKAFLHSLVQPQDHLLDVFVGAGIQNEEALRGFAALPEEEQLKLLRTDLRLNVLQSRIIRHGLVELAG